jgi:DNA-binding transcriptional MerR regulator
MEFSLSDDTDVTIEIKTASGKGFTMQDIKRLIALLELQRSFLADEPLDVIVSVVSPRASRVVENVTKGVNVANIAEVLQGKL